MSIGVLHGQNGGGIKLPFRVIGGTTQPSNPKDGDIWVKTSVPITHLEFNNNTWASGGVGMVFLDGTLGGSNPTGTNTTVYVLNTKVGGIIHREKITLTGCKQVQGSTGNWVNLDAYRYYGGKWVQFSSGSVIPEFTYTGDYEIVNDADETITVSPDNWKIRFLTSGTLTFTKLNVEENGIDVFCVGGGGASRWGGGGGGYTTTQKRIPVSIGTPYDIVIGAGGGSEGANGGETSAFGVSAKGGYGGKTSGSEGDGGDGGCGGGGWGQPNGGSGGTDGSDGVLVSGTTMRSEGKGQGTTTREFGELNAKTYAGGGSGGYDDRVSSGVGGSYVGGSGKGDSSSKNGQTNTGGGGGGRSGNTTFGCGGSGIVVIRNAREVS